MGERIDELKGQTKEAIGSLTDNEDMKNEGRAEKNSAKAKREAEGAADQVTGKFKEGVGAITDDESTEAEGELQQKKGDLKRAG